MTSSNSAFWRWKAELGVRGFLKSKKLHETSLPMHTLNLDGLPFYSIPKLPNMLTKPSSKHHAPKKPTSTAEATRLVHLPFQQPRRGSDGVLRLQSLQHLAR